MALAIVLKKRSNTSYKIEVDTTGTTPAERNFLSLFLGSSASGSFTPAPWFQDAYLSFEQAVSKLLDNGSGEVINISIVLDFFPPPSNRLL